MKHIKEFLNGKVIYDKASNMFFVNSKDGQQMVLDMRGWGHIQNMFRDGQKYDLDAAAEYQDRIGEFIAEAINEKMEREFTQCDHDYIIDMYDHFGFPSSRVCDKCNRRESI